MSKLENKAATKVSIPFDTKLALGNYVYALRDPETQEVFYVGKGVGNRILQHTIEAKKNLTSEKAKLKRINQIEAKGLEVEHLFIRTGIATPEEALAIEQAVIDAYAANRKSIKGGWVLTNLVAGHEHDAKGLASFKNVIAKHQSLQTSKIDRPLLVFKLNRQWEPDMSEQSLLDVARGVWKVGAESREKAELAVVIAYGVIRGIYEIDKGAWQRATEKKHQGKWIFSAKRTSDKKLLALIGTDMGKKVRVQANFQKFLDGFDKKA